VGQIIAFVNRKGGVGKSSCVHHLGGALAGRGHRVLLVDTDPQASLTQGLLGPEAARALPPHETIAALYGDAVDPAGLVRPLPFPDLALLPGSGALDTYNLPDPWKCGESQFLLREALGEVRDDFDLVLIDCPPHIYLSAWSSLVAADGVVVPLQAEDYGAQGLVALAESVDRVRAGANPRLRLLGYLVTMFNKSLGVHTRYDRDLREIYGADVFDVTIPMAKDYKEAVMLRQPVSAYKPRGAAAKAVESLADELLARLEPARIAPTVEAA
jgi:chromosome partitioning protein